MTFEGGIRPVPVIFRCLVGLYRKASSRNVRTEERAAVSWLCHSAIPRGQESVNQKVPLVETPSAGDLRMW